MYLQAGEMLIFVPSARFSDDESYHQGHGRAYENFGIDPKVGCLVVVRPDQYVSLISEVSDHAALCEHIFHRTSTLEFPKF